MYVIIIAQYHNEQQLKAFCAQYEQSSSIRFVLVDYGVHALQFLPRKKILFLCGDFDHFSNFEQHAKNLPIYHKLQQKETDFEFAVRILREKYDYKWEFVLFTNGPRTDMLLQIVSLMYGGVVVKWYCTDHFVYLITGRHTILPANKSRTFSLLNFSNECAEVTIQNAKYNVTKRQLPTYQSWISNITIVNKELIVDVGSAKIIIVLFDKEQKKLN